MERRRVVVTGLGSVNPLGTGVDAFWKAAQDGVSGIGPITNFDASGLAVQFAGEGKDVDPEISGAYVVTVNGVSQSFAVNVLGGSPLL